MKYKIKFENPPIGHAAEYNAETRTVSVTAREFLSSEDGDLLI